MTGAALWSAVIKLRGRRSALRPRIEFHGSRSDLRDVSLECADLRGRCCTFCSALEGRELNLYGRRSTLECVSIEPDVRSRRSTLQGHVQISWQAEHFGPQRAASVG